MSYNKPEHGANDFPPEILGLFDQYVHGDIDRRAFLAGATKFAVGGLTALGFLNALSPKFAQAEQVPPTDHRVRPEYVEIDSPLGYGKVRGYLVRPAKVDGKLPAVLVIHENRGLNPHIEDIARRVALDNFIAFAPDALYPLGGYPADEDKAREIFPKLDQTKTLEDFIAAFKWLKNHPNSSGSVGAVGFCYGGSTTNTLATRIPELRAAVPFYGGAPVLDKVANIKSPLLLHFAGKDERVNATWPPYEAALKAAGVRYTAYQYADVQHGFNNDTTPRYDESAAKLAWQRTIAFFNTELRT